MICVKNYFTELLATVVTVIALQRLIMQAHMLTVHSPPVKQTHTIAHVVPNAHFQ